MKGVIRWMTLAGLLSVIWASTAMASDPNDGLTLWGMGASGVETARAGYYFANLALEPGIQGRHNDAVGDAQDEWSVGGYLLFHAITADTVTHLFGEDTTIPKGDLYIGAAALYWVDREDEFSGSLLMGGMVDAGDVIAKSLKGIKLVTEYEWNVLNMTDNNYILSGGVVIRF